MKRAFFRIFAVLLALGILRAPAASGQKENEYYPDGSLKIEYIAFDDNGNPTEYIYYTGGKGRDAKQVFSCTYDAEGRLETETITLPDGTFLQSYLTEYDENGFVARRTYTNEEGGPPAGVIEYTRDADGNCIRQVDRDLLTGEAEDIELENGLAVRRTILDGEGAVEFTGTLSYDENGNLSEYRVLDAEGSLLFVQKNEYDEQGRIIHFRIYDETGALVSETDTEYTETGFTETYREYREHLAGTTITEYDEYGEMLSRKVYDENGNLTGTVTPEP